MLPGRTKRWTQPVPNWAVEVHAALGLFSSQVKAREVFTPYAPLVLTPARSGAVNYQWLLDESAGAAVNGVNTPQ